MEEGRDLVIQRIELVVEHNCYRERLVTDTVRLYCSLPYRYFDLFGLKVFKIVPRHLLLLEQRLGSLSWNVGHSCWNRAFKLVRFDYILDLFTAVSELQRVIRLTAEVLRGRQTG